jgi:DNA-binding NarL/FixJ family response regulator
MFALEFAGSLARDRPQLGPIAIPSSLLELVRARVQRCPEEVRRLLAIVAACERPTRSLLTAVDAAAPSLLEAAVDSGDVTIDADGIVRFVHPLFSSAAYAELQLGERRAVHRRLADASEDPEERARHLTLASVAPDAAIAALLDAAARRARARGAPDAAAELAQEAVHMTPTDNVVDREERKLAVARYLSQAGRHSDATACLDALLATGIAGPTRARALLLSMPVQHDLDIAASSLEEALEHVGEDGSLRAEVLLGLSACATARNEHAAGEKFAREAASLAEESDDPALLAAALTTVARRAALAGRPEPALLDRGLALAEVHGTLPLWPTPRMVAAIDVSLREGDLPRARELLEAELEAILHEGREYNRARVLHALVEVEWRAGRWACAERHLDDVDELAAFGEQTAELYALMARGRILAARGDIEHARRLLAEAAALGQALHLREPGIRWASGFVELSVGEHERAYEALQDVEAQLSLHAFELERLDAVANSVEALVALGRLEQAEEPLAALEVSGLEAHLWAAPAAQRCRALLLLARAHGTAAAEAAQQAAASFEAAGFPLDHGRALLVAGEALRRMGARRQAGKQLDAARTIFDRLGAVAWAERTERELRRARPRPRSDRELTHAERRVAALVALGKKNREVAAQLFTTVATVEAHLTRIYRKLGIRSRTELARLVADGRLSLDED